MQVSDRRSTQRLILAAFRAKAKLSAFAGRVDGLCRRMNSGLAAVAIVLGLVLMATIAVRGAELTADGLLSAERGLPVAIWPY